MSIQIDVEKLIRRLVSAMYESSDEDMEIDTQSTTVIVQSHDGDSDVDLIACYIKIPVFPPQLVAGQAMTLDFNACREELVKP